MAPPTDRKHPQSAAESSSQIIQGRVAKFSRKSPEKACKYENDGKEWSTADRLLVYKMRCDGKPYDEIVPLIQRSSQALRLITYHARKALRDLDQLDETTLRFDRESAEGIAALHKAAEKRAAAYEKDGALESAAKWEMHKMPEDQPESDVKAKPKQRSRAVDRTPPKPPTRVLLPAPPQATAAPPQPVRDFTDRTADMIQYFERLHTRRRQPTPYMYPAHSPAIGAHPPLHTGRAEAVRTDNVFVLRPQPQLLPPNANEPENIEERRDSNSPVNKMSIDFFTQ